MRQTYVIDDAVPEEFQERVETLVLQQPWKLAGHNKKYFPAVFKNKNYPPYSFGSTILDSTGIVNLELYEKISLPLLSLVKNVLPLKEDYIILNRSFLQIPLNEKFHIRNHGIHIDNDLDHYVMLYYLTDSDGETIIYEQSKHEIPGNVEKGMFEKKITRLTEHARILPKRGRIVLFDGSRWHCASQPSESLRCVLNFNLIQKE